MKKRASYLVSLNNRKNKLKHTGFSYGGEIFKRSLSNVMYAETKRAGILSWLETLMVFIVDSVKHIKKTANYAIPKNFRNFN